MNKNKYFTNIYWDEDDKCWIAKVPALRGCVSHGNTFDEAAKSIQEVIKGWIKAVESTGHKAPEPDNPDAALEEIHRLSPILNMSKLARLTGIKRTTLTSKLVRRTAFTKQEAKRILKAVRSF